jgi:hypothetical protein
VRDLYRDARRVVLALLAGFLLYFVVMGLPAGAIGFLLGRYTSPDITALRDTIRMSDTVYITQTDTIEAQQADVDSAKADSDSLDSLVSIVDDSTVAIKPELESDTIKSRLEILPPVVVANIAALRLTVATQDTLILSLYRRDSTQQWRIETRDKLIAELSRKNPLACGRKCGFALGVLGSIAVYKAVK